MQPSDEIKAKLDIVDVLREYIQLKPAGVNFRAPCPFHHEKTPSFIVSPEKQIWHCFGCGKGGDIFSFVMETEGISFVEALRMLAQKAGVQLKRQDPKLISQRNRLLDIMELASRFYHKNLLEAGEAKGAREYLTERGLTEDTIREWQIGYSPDNWDGLLNFLKTKGYAENEIFSAGLSVKKEIRRAATNGAHANGEYGSFYDRFRGRIMFPIRDASGAPVAFSARVLPPYAEASEGKSENSSRKMGLSAEALAKVGKYINSPTTLIYDKSKIIFGLDKAKQEIKKEEQAILTEGQMDVITAHQHGFKNVVASSGTALTAEQVNLLKRYSANIALSFDMDKAGEMAAERGIRGAMAAEMNIKVIQLPPGKDPDECIRTNPREWEKAAAMAKPVMEYYFDKTFVGLDLSGTEDRRKAAEVLLPVLAKLKNKIEQDFWLKKLSEAINVPESILRETLQTQVSKEGTLSAAGKEKAGGEASARPLRPREELLSELFLALLFKFPQLIEYAVNHVQPEQIIGSAQLLYRNLLIYYNIVVDYWTQEEGKNKIPHISYGEFKLWLENPGGEETDRENERGADGDAGQLKLLDTLALLGDENFYGYEYEQAKNEAIRIAAVLRKYYLSARMKETTKLIAPAENSGDRQSIEVLMQEFKTLTDELKELENN